ncbi:DUF3558 domain-containing protein [Nocardia sp. CDC159]|uniref:DUF3558 domain-containing protein n=1 Tax=Nocardia pulmonis TaxID=2951408 RepID=A0A9X2E6C4_9NOCA|nr:MULTISPECIES: DUF3558 domain-containing protein [Nocardia]MCM6775064.1 DUF3558 domain-containing protein [Nocardia pulmonis]MCM6789534.1 DUF3558 domain-containing protein [Nocardia sp. CDC159]
MRVRIAAVGLAAVAVAVTAAGCGRTVPGTAQPAGGGGGGVNMNFDKLLRECDVVAQDQIAKLSGAQDVVSSFNGAVCMYTLSGAPGGDGMATLNWYEMGTLSNEKQNNDRLGYVTTDMNVQGRRSLQVRRPNDADSCGVMAPAADTGIIGWWLNYRPGGHPDPCDVAQKLAELTLNLAR